MAPQSIGITAPPSHRPAPGGRRRGAARRPAAVDWRRLAPRAAIVRAALASFEEPPISSRPCLAVDLRAAVRAPTGIGVYTVALIRELARRGRYEVVGLAHREPSVGEALRAAGVRIEVSPAPLGVLWQQGRLPARLARGDVDLFWSPLLTLPRRTPVPAVVTIHDLAVLEVPETLPWKVRWSLLPFLAHTVDRADRIVVGTAKVAGELERAFPAARGKCSVVPHGVDPAFRPASLAERDAIRHRLDAPDGYLLAVGTLEPRKNLELLLDAWELLASRRDAAAPPLLLVGPPGWKDERLRRRIARSAESGVRYLGRLDPAELIAAYQGAIGLAYPSRYEGFGLPVAEALACGRPVVIAADSSPAEVAGAAGIPFEPESVESLVAALERLLAAGTDTDAEARATARAARYSWPAAAAALEAIFDRVLAGAAA
jgi:glycosyltransferase involved in cell wall biosynthesis